ncbi:hypothetical protein FPOAC1_004393 [Fusarium poae]|uniref:hypothetical protein n=1 Tax=Fusarium poae TaxID=36050 RepID=UPI001CEA833B|nr:hypothetical protein FPOAC1_004393 [Fusarium poae]KAG8671154.1 hypothetical protein FPOAC1_004393 [Fusarium poae]
MPAYEYCCQCGGMIVISTTCTAYMTTFNDGASPSSLYNDPVVTFTFHFSDLIDTLSRRFSVSNAGLFSGLC